MKRLALLVLVSTVSCRTATESSTTATGAKGAAPIRLTLVGTNDWHGWVMGQSDTYKNGDIKAGGAPTFAAYLKILREDNPGGVVLVDAGDLFQGTLMSNNTEGSVVIDAFNLLGFDAAAIGNHEFDYGPVGPISAATQPDMDPFGALKARLAQARFPMLSANIYVESTGLRPSWLPGDGTVLIERKGVKIGIIGLTTPQTPSTTLPINVASLRFSPMPPETLGAAQRLRERGAELVIAVVHAGGRCGDCTKPHDVSTCDLYTGEVFELLNSLPPGTLDAVVAGHTHAQISHFVNGTPVMESFALGRFFGLTELYVDPVTHKVVKDLTTIHSGVEICETQDQISHSCDSRRVRPHADVVKPEAVTFRGQTITADENVLVAMRPAEKRLQELQEQELGLSVPSTFGRNYENESALGSLVADSMRDMIKADIAIMNPGGLRADLKKGPLKYGAVFEVFPFDNTVATVEVSGEQLERMLAAAFGSRKGVFQVSGLEVKLDRCPAPDRFKGATLSGGKPIEKDKHYKVVMPDFLARGGDGLGPFLNTIDPGQVDLGERRGNNIRDELVTYWQEHREAFQQPKSGRVAFLGDGSACAATMKPGAQPGSP